MEKRAWAARAASFRRGESSVSSRLRLAAILAAAAILLGCAACSSLSVRHLEGKAWTPHEPQTLAMKFWRFDYVGVPLGDRLGVKGQAFPVRENLPDWAVRVESLTLTAYLRDKQGNILASDKREFLPMDLDPQKGAPFDFFLSPGSASLSGLSVSFGYRAMLVSKDKAGRSAPGSATIPDGEVFFAEEGALIKH